MDHQRINIAKACLDASYAKTMSFPEIIGALLDAGFESYLVDYRTNTTTYYLPDGDHIALANHPTEGTVGAEFDAAGIAIQVKWAQANPRDYTYKGFCENVKTLGCAGYIVSFSGRRVVYFGRTAKTHVEHFPQ